VKPLDEHKHSIYIYKISNRLEKYVNKSELIPLNKLTKLPMIVKPDPYERITKDGKAKEILGGFLSNDEYMEEEIIIKN